MRQRQFFILVFLAMLFSACRDIYKPDIAATDKSYLVVEGVLNVSGPTELRLSRTMPLYAAGENPVTNAVVTVEERNGGAVRSLAHTAVGRYTSPDLNLVVNNEYRLRIRTVQGEEFLSDYVVAKITPPIDSISWKQSGEGVRLYVNTHDASGNTRYYRWNYEETWEIHSFYNSRYIYENGVVRQRNSNESVLVCWKHGSSNAILIGSSARLQSDVIFEAPLHFIESGNEKPAIRYSILVRQYALDKECYAFFEQMKRNTESIGTIFDPQPSELRGNIRNVADSTEPVIGYVTASSFTEKRIFITPGQLPGWRFNQFCPPINIRNDPDSLRLAYLGGGLLPVDANYSPTGVIVSYLSSYNHCVDCTTRGGSLVRPSFW